VSSPADSDRPKTPGKRAGKGGAKGKPAATGSRHRSRLPAASAGSGNGEPGILSNLPSTRPQRPSARRAAAKRATARLGEDGPLVTKRSSSEPTRGKPTPSEPAGGGLSDSGSAGGVTTKRTTRPRRTSHEPAIPRQGFETEDEIEQGMPVEPPSRPELAGAVAELLGELAQTGIARGGRIFKEAFGRLPGL